MRAARRFMPMKSELILRSLPRFSECVKFEDSYKKFISKINDKNDLRNSKELLVFPVFAFKKFPKATIDNLLKYSYNTLKDKNLLKIHDYNTMLGSYMVHEIDFEISTILMEMKNNHVLPNNTTYLLLIELYSRRGDTASVKNLINIMKEKDFQLNQHSRRQIYCAFIRAGQIKAGEEFLKEENMKLDDFELLVESAKAYADICNFNDVIEKVKKIIEIDPNVSNKLISPLYRRLVKAGATDLQLNEILAIGDLSKAVNNLSGLVFDLNRDGFYNHSLKLLLKFGFSIMDRFLMTDVVLSFNTSDCPINTYKVVLENFLEASNSDVSSLFTHMSYNTAFTFSEQIINTKNNRLIMGNLIKIAFRENTITRLEAIFQLSRANMTIHAFNTTIQFVFIPELLENNATFKRPQDIVQELPSYKWTILGNLFMHYLSLGDFASFRELLEEFPCSDLTYMNYSKRNAKRILEEVSFEQLNKLSEEAGKVFSPPFVNWLVGSVIVERVIQLSVTEDRAGIEAAVATAKDMKVTFSEAGLTYITKAAPKYSELFEQFSPSTEEFITAAESNVAE